MYKCSRIVHNIIILRRLRRAPEADAVTKDDAKCSTRSADLSAGIRRAAHMLLLRLVAYLYTHTDTFGPQCGGGGSDNLTHAGGERADDRYYYNIIRII
jgi:hypothetical protein